MFESCRVHQLLSIYMLCEYCYKEFTGLVGKSNHERYCKLGPNRSANILKLKSRSTSATNKMYEVISKKVECSCKFCDKSCSSILELNGHSIRCKANPNRVGAVKYTEMSSNPFLVFSDPNISDSIKSSIIRKYVKSINDIIKVNIRIGDRSKTPFLLYLIKFDHLKLILIKLYNELSTRQISVLLKAPQTTISYIYGPKNLNISNRSMRSSKIHLQMKPVIESILGNSTITEYRINKYWIDEYDPVRKLCIEIDGAWCHNSVNDIRRDSILTSLGYKVVRIPAFSNKKIIESILLDSAK